MRLHASCVAFPTGGLLITGPSGSGKSGAVLGLLTHGLARLVSDDHTLLSNRAGRLYAMAPLEGRGCLEVRQVGILRYPALNEAPVRAVVELTEDELERLPGVALTRSYLGCALPCLRLPARDPQLVLKVCAAYEIAVGVREHLPV
jgi:HPr kinase/phosphorylase